MVLEEQHPDVASEFHKGNVVIHKSRRDFSAMAIDQAHEQNTAVMKEDGVPTIKEDCSSSWCSSVVFTMNNARSIIQ